MQFLPHSRHAKGSMLMEVCSALAIMLGLSLGLLRYSLNIIQVDQWTITQAMSEAALSYEVAYMEQIPFREILAEDSTFPEYPAYYTPDEPVTLGTLASGSAITGTIKRTRRLTNSTDSSFALQSWTLYTILEYNINGKPYYKSRSTVRTR